MPSSVDKTIDAIHLALRYQLSSLRRPTRIVPLCRLINLVLSGSTALSRIYLFSLPPFHPFHIDFLGNPLKSTMSPIPGATFHSRRLLISYRKRVLKTAYTSIPERDSRHPCHEYTERFQQH